MQEIWIFNKINWFAGNLDFFPSNVGDFLDICFISDGQDEVQPSAGESGPNVIQGMVLQIRHQKLNCTFASLAFDQNPNQMKL